MRETLHNAIIEVLKILELPTGIPFIVEHPTDLTHGDYATNVALAYAKEAGKNPRELAGEIMEALIKLDINDVAAYEIAGPGFINVTLTPSFFNDTVASIIGNSDYGKQNLYTGKKILVEHSSPNLFKPFHIGHFMNNAIGESLVRLMQYSGAEVRTMSFPSDISLGVAKAIFTLLEKYGEGFSPTDIAVLGDAYVEGTKRYDEDESIHARVKEIADNLYAKNVSSPEYAMFEIAKAFNIAYFESVTRKLGSHFDSYIYESEAGGAGKEIVQKNTPSVFTESEGAIVYIPEEEKKNLHTAVFINSQSNPTYEAKDLGLLSMKFDREHPDISIFITDDHQVSHFNVVLDAAEKINPEWVEKSRHIHHGRMTFKGQKMSSRLGGVPLVTDLIGVVQEEAQARAKNIQDNNSGEAVAIAALKFAVLRSEAGKNINFDPDTSLSFEGDSGPYLQYTHARLNSLLEKAHAEGFTPDTAELPHLSDVHRLLYRFPEVIHDAIVAYAPHMVTMYLLELTHAFNSYYGATKIIDTDDKQGTQSRLALVAALRVVLKNGLKVLAIEAPERM